MKGFVETPEELCENMVKTLFQNFDEDKNHPRILFPGCGRGPFIETALEELGDQDAELVGVEQHPDRASQAKEKFADEHRVEILEKDFLLDYNPENNFDLAIGNPPYVSIESLKEDEKERYRREFHTAKGRFDLYILFFEKTIKMLSEEGLMSFVTPEKYEYINSASYLREKIARGVIEIEHLPEDAFDDLITYPIITTLKRNYSGSTRVETREGVEKEVNLPKDGKSWAKEIREDFEIDVNGNKTLEDVTQRVSCGVATGADKIFVHKQDEIPDKLGKYSFKTVSGRKLGGPKYAESESAFISPYNKNGNLMQEDNIPEFIKFAKQHEGKLKSRSCVEKQNKDWYSWHENPPMEDMLQPKILCKDVTDEPQFWIDESGDIVPRHSVYYVIPDEQVDLEELWEYLNGEKVRKWLETHCQRAHNDYYRLQSKVLKKIPVPEKFSDEKQRTLKEAT